LKQKRHFTSTQGIACQNVCAFVHARVYMLTKIKSFYFYQQASSLLQQTCCI